MGMARPTRPVSWIKAARKDFEAFPQEAQLRVLQALTIAAEGGKADIAKPLTGFGSGVFEGSPSLPRRGVPGRVRGAVGCGYLGGTCVPEEIQARHSNPARGTRCGTYTVETAQGDVAMSNDDFEFVRGSGNVFRDLGHPHADAEQLRAILAAEIIHVLDERALTVRQAGGLTGIAAADFSRIRNAHLSRFTIDRLMTILNRLDRKVEVQQFWVNG